MCDHTNTIGQEHMGYKVKYDVTKAKYKLKGVQSYEFGQIKMGFHGRVCL